MNCAGAGGRNSEFIFKGGEYSHLLRRARKWMRGFEGNRKHVTYRGGFWKCAKRARGSGESQNVTDFGKKWDSSTSKGEARGGGVGGHEQSPGQNKEIEDRNRKGGFE